MKHILFWWMQKIGTTEGEIANLQKDKELMNWGLVITSFGIIGIALSIISVVFMASKILL